MTSTRNVLQTMTANVNESIGIRSTELRPALSPVASAKDIGRRPNRSFGQIEIDRIQPDPDQPRVEFDEEALTQLAANIRDRGQMAPIRVRWSESNGKWLIISGERRWRAANRAGLKTIDCYFQEQALSPTRILEEQLIENLLRQDLRPIEEAESFQRLMQVNTWNGKQLASALNISPTHVSRALALLKLPHEMRVRIDTGELSARAGYELSKLPEPQITQAVDSGNLSLSTAPPASFGSERAKRNLRNGGLSRPFSPTTAGRSSYPTHARDRTPKSNRHSSSLWKKSNFASRTASICKLLLAIFNVPVTPWRVAFRRAIISCISGNFRVSIPP